MKKQTKFFLIKKSLFSDKMERGGKMDDSYFITIFGWMHERLGLKSHEEKVYALVYSFSNNGENTCNTSQKTISRMCNCGINTVKRALIDLEKKELIKSRDVIRNNVKYKEYWVTDKYKEYISSNKQKDENEQLEEDVEIKEKIINKYNIFYDEYCTYCEKAPQNIDKKTKESIMYVMNCNTIDEVKSALKNFNTYVKDKNKKARNNYIYILNNIASWKDEEKKRNTTNKFNNFKSRKFTATESIELEESFYV